MSTGEIIALIIVGLLMGFSIGAQVIAYLLEDRFKKTLNSECVNCKHLKECLGHWRKNKDNGKCKLFNSKGGKNNDKN